MALIWLPNESDPAAQIKVVRAAALMNFLPLVIKAACLRGMINGPQRSCRPSASIPTNAVARKLTKPSTGPGPGSACGCAGAAEGPGLERQSAGQRRRGSTGTWAHVETFRHRRKGTFLTRSLQRGSPTARGEKWGWEGAAVGCLQRGEAFPWYRTGPGGHTILHPTPVPWHSSPGVRHSVSSIGEEGRAEGLPVCQDHSRALSAARSPRAARGATLAGSGCFIGLHLLGCR